MSDMLDEVVRSVQDSPKYRAICEPLVRRIAQEEVGKRRKVKEAVKHTKNKLHQVGGAYLDDAMRYDGWLEMLRDASAENLKAVCREIMQHHASTRERLPILDEFYSAILAEIGPINSVVDVACGLNPLAIPFMGLADGTRYYAYDIYHDLMAFLGQSIQQMGMVGQAEAQDVITFEAFPAVDVALVLKTLPCLVQVDKSAAKHLLDALNAPQIVVSYPVRSLGGRQKGMAETYEKQLMDLVAAEKWSVKRLEFSAELVFILRR